MAHVHVGEGVQAERGYQSFQAVIFDHLAVFQAEGAQRSEASQHAQPFIIAPAIIEV